MLDTIPYTSVHSNLEHRLAILTEKQRALVHSDLSYTTSLVEVQSRSDMVKPHEAILCHVC